MEVLRMTTGEKIRYFRTSHELTQEQLASQSGLSISALQKYESDERKPKPEQLLKISDTLGISINIFMDFDIRTVSDFIKIQQLILSVFLLKMNTSLKRFLLMQKC